MDLLEIKSRIAEALVESIFRRARCDVRPFKGDPLPLRFGREDFSPDFWVCQKPPDAEEREYLVEVKYRPSIEQFISVENQRGERSVLCGVGASVSLIDAPSTSRGPPPP